jgi:hypothetical protein
VFLNTFHALNFSFMPLLATIPNFTLGPWRAGYVFPEALDKLIATIHARHRGNVVRRKRAEMDHWSWMLAQQHLSVEGHVVLRQEIANLRAVWQSLVGPGDRPLPGIDRDWRWNLDNYYTFV